MRIIKSLFKTLLTAAIFGGLSLAAVPALALQMPGYGGYTTGSQDTAQNYPVSANKSYNWAGYTAAGNNFTSVTGTWNVPNAGASSSLSADATWVGVGGVNTPDLIQAGTQAISQNGNVKYQAWFETLPQGAQNMPLNINPGDSVTASVSQQSPGQWLISLRDNASGQSYQTNVQYNSSLSSAEWVEEMPLGGNSFIPLDNFGSVSFSRAAAVENGQSLTAAQAGAQAMGMLNSSNQDLAVTSALGNDGASFVVTRTSAASTSGLMGLGAGRYRRRGRGVNSVGSVPRTTPATIPAIAFPNGNAAQIFRLFGFRPHSFAIQMDW